MKVFYRPEMSVAKNSNYSPSAGKPGEVVKDWLQRGLIDESDIESFEPATMDQLYAVHDRDMVNDVLSLRRYNGFNNMNQDVAASLPYTSGSMIAASRYAIQHNAVVCSPTSGFHHASYYHPAGFCTFNGLMVAAACMKAAGLVQQVMILDCDAHYGDGTDDIKRRLKMDYVHNKTMGMDFIDQFDAGNNGERYLKDLEDYLIDMIDEVDLVLYQAGADPHINDPLGGILSTEAMQTRDRMVFELCKGKPLVWNLAGGYQRSKSGGIEPILELHRNTLIELKGVYA